MKIKATKIFQKNWDAINEVDENGKRKYRYIINEGSSRSSKTWSLNQLAYLKLVSEKNKRITVWRKAKTDCRATVYRDFYNFLNDADCYLYETIRHNKTESAFYSDTQSQIEFNGTDDHQKVHGLTQSIAWFNEINEVTKDVFDQIDQRTSDFILIDWNPSQNHWVDKLKLNPRTLVIHSTFLDNPFCPLESKIKLQGYEPTKENIAKGTADKYMWDVYGLGLKSEKPNKVYHNWHTIDRMQFDKLPYTSYYGLDFGNTHPTVLTEVKYNDGNFYINELLYKPGKEFESLIDEMDKLGIKRGSEMIICDSAAPDLIMELKMAGFYAMPAVKGSGSVITGINFMQRAEIHLTSDSENGWNEYELYEFEVDRYGLATDKPIKRNDDFLDSARYCCVFIQKYLQVTI